jgi:hypothetical protein
MVDTGVIVASALIIMIYSFLYRENIVFRIAEGAFVGASVGRVLAINFDTFRRSLWAPAIQGSYYLFIPVLLGILYIALFLKGPYRWLYRVPVSFVLGSGLGLALAGIIKVSLVDQIRAVITTPLVGVSLYQALSNLVIILATATVTFVFFFTRPHEGILKYVTLVGRLFLMIYLGYQFAGTIMMRESVLISQLNIILKGDGIWLVPIAFILLGIGVYYDWKNGKLQWMG